MSLEGVQQSAPDRTSVFRSDRRIEADARSSAAGLTDAASEEAGSPFSPANDARRVSNLIAAARAASVAVVTQPTGTATTEKLRGVAGLIASGGAAPNSATAAYAADAAATREVSQPTSSIAADAAADRDGRERAPAGLLVDRRA